VEADQLRYRDIQFIGCVYIFIQADGWGKRAKK